MNFSLRRALAGSLTFLALSLFSRAEDLSSYKTADALWQHLEQLKQGPPEEPKSPAALTAFVQNMAEVAQAFSEKYPADPRRWMAKILAAQLQFMAAKSKGEQPSEETLKTALEAIANAPEATQEAREEAAFYVLMIAFEAQKFTPELEAKVRAYAKDYPESKHLPQVLMTHLELLRSSDPAQAEAKLRALARSPIAPLAAAAQGELNGMEVTKKPFDLKFKSVTGEQIDLTKMRGKVVLIDFWATWCMPCMAEVPHVVAAYQALHEKGFEVLGISLDEDKAKVLSVTKQKGMAWPQYFDGQGWENAISASYGIRNIPTMWLVNKNGMIVDQNAADGLQAKVEKLLKE